MNQQDWCEYMRDVKETFHLTNAYIAQGADVSIKTVESIMALNYDKDILRATARRIELVVIGPVSSFICRLDRNDTALTDQIAALQQEVAYWRKENDRKAKIIDKFLTD